MPPSKGGGRGQPEPSGFLVEKVRVWSPQRRYVSNLLEDKLGEAATEGRFRFFGHVLLSQLRDPWEWVPIDHRLIEPLDEYVADGREWPCSEEVWRPLFEHSLLLYRDHDRMRQQSREFRAPEEVIRRYLALGPRTVEEAQNQSAVDLFTGKVTTRVAKTLRYDGSKNPIGSELYRQAMKQLQKGVFNEPRVLEHLEQLEQELKEAEATWADAGRYEFVDGVRERLQSLDLSDSSDHHSHRLRSVLREWENDHGEPRTAAYLAYRTALYRYENDLRCWQDGLLAQRPEETDTEGVYRYRLAYRHQTSGRSGQIKGGLQSCSREMKEAAYAGTGVRNYDLRGSQPNMLVEEFEAANELGGGHLDECPLDTSWLRRYVENERGKYEWAERVGVAVGTWKAALCAVMMGATLPKDPQGSRGDLVTLLRSDPAGNTAEGFGRVFEAFGDAVGGFYEELQRWHEWLDAVYVRQHGQNTPVGRAVTNAAGETYAWDRRKPPYKRRAELAAHMLQGRERAFILHLIALAPAYGFEPVSDEHDGLVSIGAIPEVAVEEAKRRSGVHRAELVEKPFT